MTREYEIDCAQCYTKFQNNHRFAKHLIHLDKFPAVKYTNMRKPFLQNFERTIYLLCPVIHKCSKNILYMEAVTDLGHQQNHIVL